MGSEKKAQKQELPKGKLWVEPGEIYSRIRGTLKLSEKDNNTFEIYDVRDGVLYAECKFNNDMIDNAKSVLGEKVVIYGRCIYKPDTMFPYKVIEISKINVLVDDPNAIYAFSEMGHKITGGKNALDWKKDIHTTILE